MVSAITPDHCADMMVSPALPPRALALDTTEAVRMQALRAACPQNVEVQLVQAGHCPHDEAPTLVNAALVDFLRSRVEARSAGQPVPVLG